MNYNKIVVFGHSFVPQLEHYCNHYNFMNLRLSDVQVDFIGDSGLRLSDMDTFELQVRASQPQVIILILGENDISENTDILALSSRINEAAAKLSSWGGGVQVIVSQLMPRFYLPSYWYFVQDYNTLAQNINFQLFSQPAPPLIRHWSHDFICEGQTLNFSNSRHFFSCKGVHLNRQGNERLAKSLVKALLYCRHWLIFVFTKFIEFYLGINSWHLIWCSSWLFYFMLCTYSIRCSPTGEDAIFLSFSAGGNQVLLVFVYVHQLISFNVTYLLWCSSTGEDAIFFLFQQVMFISMFIHLTNSYSR